MDLNQNTNNSGVVQDRDENDLKGESAKGIFSRERSVSEETPDWLRAAGQAKEGKIANVADVSLEDVTSKDMADSSVHEFREDKPTVTQLGINPASWIEVTPDLEVVEKKDVEAAEKMSEAGYDPKTGHKVEVQKQDLAKTAEVKKSLLGNIKSLFDFHSKNHKETIAKVEGDENAKISAEEKKKYIEAEKIYQEGLATIKDLIAP